MESTLTGRGWPNADAAGYQLELPAEALPGPYPVNMVAPFQGLVFYSGGQNQSLHAENTSGTHTVGLSTALVPNIHQQISMVCGIKL